MTPVTDVKPLRHPQGDAHMESLLKLLPGPQPIHVRYGIAAFLVLLMFGIRLGLQERTGLYAFIIYIPAVVASALLFDRGTGYFAVALSAAVVAWTLPWTPDRAEAHFSALATFILIAGGLVFISEGLHRALERAEAATRERDLLLQEMSHRVKNKFAMIHSIIGLQAREATPDAKAALEAVAGRVMMIASLHDQLQLSRQGGIMEISEYLSKLQNTLAPAAGYLRPVSLTVTADRHGLPPQMALAVGLIVNELVTNAFKYAFPDDRAGAIAVNFRCNDGLCELAVVDNGVGGRNLPGLGTRLVNILAAQLGGTAQWDSSASGTRVVVTFAG